MAWLIYLTSSAHWPVHRKMFAGTETRGQLDFVSRDTVEPSPAVAARGTLATFAYDATATLPAIPAPADVVAADGDRTTIPEASHIELVGRHAECRCLVGDSSRTADRGARLRRKDISLRRRASPWRLTSCG